ncbi:hypothetical protein ACFLW4_06585 [Chloroflexota bacterium]
MRGIWHSGGERRAPFLDVALRATPRRQRPEGRRDEEPVGDNGGI